ncbi:glycine betaine ABC transporter substrate-binding protein [uncultured Amnibacterium sp.]|uniref:ABC transporter substrate-binding protein n=1 Tax=uncultured Amnibacterium sp. TaxID=1631851 RepID=UPI0035CA726F
MKRIDRRRFALVGALAIATTVSLAACSSGDTLAGNTPAASSSGGAGDKSLVVATTPYPETQVVAQIYGQVLAKNGYTVSYKQPGQRATLYPALKSGEVNLTPEYLGSLANFLGNKDALTDADTAKTKLDSLLKADGLTALTPAEASDSDALVVLKSFAEKYGVTSFGDLKKAGTVTLAANKEFSTRPDGLKALKSVYGLSNIKFKAIQDGGGPATVKALKNGSVQVADIYTTSQSFTDPDFVALKDDKGQFGPQNIVPVLTTAKADAKATELLNGISAKLSQQQLIDLDTKAFADKADPAAIAKDWITAQGL